MAKIEDKWGDVPLRIFNDPRMKGMIVQWRDSRGATPRAADVGVTVLNALLRFGLLRGKVMINVAAAIPSLYVGSDRSEIIWTEDDISRFTERAEQMGAPPVADALRLAVLTGLRREDLVTLTWGQIGIAHIIKKALKASRGRRCFASAPYPRARPFACRAWTAASRKRSANGSRRQEGAAVDAGTTD